jgi:2-C-methyl-D-erythritol 4-phosphate cytidylyltransferase
VADSTSRVPLPDVAGIVVAAGSGHRFGDRDKILREIAGRPMFLWAVDAAAAVAGHVTVVVRPGSEDAVREYLPPVPGGARPVVVAGGERRQDSVRAGLAAPGADKVEIVAVLDAARPMTSDELVEATVASARRRGSGVAGRRVVDTVKEAGEDGRVTRTVDREGLWRVETPQTFRRDLLDRALSRVQSMGITVTDDAGALECLGEPVWLVDAAPWGDNDKVTTRDDLRRVELLMGGRLTGGRLKSGRTGSPG